MPLITIDLCGGMFSSTSACFNAVSTPKSPQPGHQSGSALPLKSLTVTRGPPASCWSIFEILASISTGSTLINYSLIAFCSGRYKRVQLRGARHIDERRRTPAVRCREAIERNEANGLFSATWLNHDFMDRDIFFSRAS